ncbi:hypothetical protein ACA910_016458 [Epithemia clementina (nom. ined.)]
MTKQQQQEQQPPEEGDGRGIFDAADSRSCAAFALVVLAASTTAIGSSAVFYPALAQLATARILGASLGFATGVMLYVSLVDIYSKSILGFEEHGHSADSSFIYTTLSFFAGIFFMKLIDWIIKRFTKHDEYEVEAGLMEEMVARNESLEDAGGTAGGGGTTTTSTNSTFPKDVTEQPSLPASQPQYYILKQHELPAHHHHHHDDHHHHNNNDRSVPQGSITEDVFMECQTFTPMPTTTTSTNDWNDFSSSSSSSSSVSSRYHKIAPSPYIIASSSNGNKGPNLPSVNQVMELVENGFVTSSNHATEPTTSAGSCRAYDDTLPSSPPTSRPKTPDSLPPPLPSKGQSHAPPHPSPSYPNHRSGNSSSDLVSMGAATATAIALHNFPEGLVTFVAYVENPPVGIALAIGIAIHNIPEGLCVAMAIFYGTGCRCKAFLWGTLCCFTSEPAGALFAWVILRNNVFSGDTYGILYGMVAGMMVFICLDELLPMAFKFDPRGTIVTWTCLAGMMMVAITLMLFKTAF